MSRKMKILVLCSLLLNVFLAGIIIGHMSDRISKRGAVGRDVREFAANLPREKAALFLKTMEKVQLKNRDAQKEIRQARKSAMAILAAPVFDEAAYRVELKRLHELHGLVKQRLGDATIDLARQSDQEERKALVEHLRRAARHGKKTRTPDTVDAASS